MNVKEYVLVPRNVYNNLIKDNTPDTRYLLSDDKKLSEDKVSEDKVSEDEVNEIKNSDVSDKILEPVKNTPHTQLDVTRSNQCLKQVSDKKKKVKKTMKRKIPKDIGKSHKNIGKSKQSKEKSKSFNWISYV